MVLHAGAGNGRGGGFEILPRSGGEERPDGAKRKRAAQQPRGRRRSSVRADALQLSAGAIAAGGGAPPKGRTYAPGRPHPRQRRPEEGAASAPPRPGLPPPPPP